MAPKIDQLGPSTSKCNIRKLDGDGDVPTTLFDPIQSREYSLLTFLGKGAYGRCYEMEENSQSSKGDNLKVALKVVSKSSLKDRMHIDKVRREVAIHKSLNHDNVIKLLSFFEDNVNLYMVLELGVYGNLLSNIQASKTGHLSELVARSYMREIVGAVVYLHEVAGILHRDLKPGNILLGLKNQIKLADFGLAVKIADLAHVSRSLSGTPNYMSPEVLDSRGHSKESEAWALGCIFYCMLVGKAPFESESLEKTFYRIRQCDYFIPLKTRISERARGLIRRLLDPDVGRRLKVINIMRCDYFSNSSTVAMTNAPVAPANDPLSFVFAGYEASAIGSYQACVLSRDSGLGVDRMRTPRPDDPLLLLNWLMSGRIDVTNDPARPVSGNVLMVNKWVDYTNRYGFGCILSDGTECVQYTDGSLYAHRNAASYERERSQLVMNPNEMPLTVYEWASVSDVSDPLILRKIKLAALFSGYMHRELQSASPLVCTDICMNYLVYQRRGNGALVMVLSDRTTQINFLETHEKLVIRFDESGDISVIVIHPERGMHSYRMWVRTSPPALAENRRVYDLVMEARCRLGDHSSRPYYATEC
uniref:Serine/threonine-protein kinase PLK n=1 Tax=Parascaris univalens TaxID=6257 RepID=A0A914ZFB9_PARUN